MRRGGKREKGQERRKRKRKNAGGEEKERHEGEKEKTAYGNPREVGENAPNSENRIEGKKFNLRWSQYH